MKIVPDNFEGEDFIDVYLKSEECDLLKEYMVICSPFFYEGKKIMLGLKLDLEDDSLDW